MMRLTKRVFSAFLAFVMVFTMLPLDAWAADGTSDDSLVAPMNVVEPDEKNKVDTYEFYEDGTLIDTQYVMSGDTVYAPASPEKEGYKFTGWNTSAEGTGDAFTPGEKTDVTGEVHTYHAVFQQVYYVFFLNRDGVVCTTKEGISGASISTADVTFPLPADQGIVGWYYDEDRTKPVQGNVVIDGANITLYPEVATGYWLTFESDGGSYIAPVFVAPGSATVQPTPPTRLGYDFKGWLDKNGQKFEFGKALTESVTLTADWQGQTVKYKVFHWWENANDDEYSFHESEEKTGTAGQRTNAAAKQYEGFTAQPVTQQTIAGDGTTIVNIYYERNEYSVKFYMESGYWWSPSWEEITNLRITAKYGADIADQWPSDYSKIWLTWDDDSAYQSGISTMPLNGASFKYVDQSGRYTMRLYYYTEVLAGQTGAKQYNGKWYTLDHTDEFKSDSPRTWTTTEEDHYDIQGFTYTGNLRDGSSFQREGSTSVYSVTFYYNRNSYQVNFWSGGSLDRSVTKQYGASIDGLSYTPDRPANVQENYEFAGWYDNAEFAGEPYEFSGTMPAQNITVYAKWAAPNVTATVHLTMAGDGEAREVIVSFGESIDESELDQYKPTDIDFENEYTWHGWATKNGDIYTPFNFDTKLTQDITLYPYYTSNAVFEVVYNANGGSGTVTDAKEYKDYAYANVQSADALTAPAGKVFLGWNTASDGNGETYLPGDKLLITEALADDNHIITLYAIWGDKAPTATLVYNANDGTGKTTTEYVANNETVQLKTAENLGFTRDGYEFLGWSTDSGASAAEFKAGRDYIVNNKDGVNTLYAVWERSVFTIKYETDGNGTVSPESEQVNSGANASGSTATPKDGYYFVNWTAEDGRVVGNEEKFAPTSVTADATYVAHFAPKTAITVKAKDFSKTYDGTKLEVKDDNWEITSGSLPDRYRLVATVENLDTFNVINVGDSRTYGFETVTIYDNNGNNVTEQFTITRLPGNLTVSKRNVTLTSGDAERAYNGEALTNENVTVGGDGFVGEEGVTYSNFASQTEVGEKSNTFDYSWKEGTNKDNYIVTPEYGTLEVTKNTDKVVVTITGQTGGAKYNGESQSVTGYDVSITLNGELTTLYTMEDFTGPAQSISASGINAGEYPMGLKEEDFQNTNANFDSVTFNVTDGKLTIGKREVTLTSGDAERAYNGEALTNENVTVGGDGFVGEEGVTYSNFASQTEVGEKSNTFDYSWKEGTNFNNYNITKTEGTLTVTAPDPTEFPYITKSHDETKEYYPGDTVTYTITVKNIFSVDALVTVTEQSGVTLVGADDGAITQILKPGTEGVYTATYTVDENDLVDNAFHNTVSVKIVPVDDGMDPIEDDATDTVPVNVPELSVEKQITSDPANGKYYVLKEEIAYKITVKNTGNVTVSNITVEDKLADKVWTIESLNPGESKEFETSHQVAEADLGSPYVNVATAEGEAPNGSEVKAEDSATATTDSRTPKLDVTKTATKPANGTEYVLDETITYTITVKNTGNVTLKDIFVSDMFSRDGGTTWEEIKEKLTPSASTPITLEPGEQKIYTYQYTVVEEDLGKTLKNTATATAPNPDDPGKPVTDEGTTDGEKVEDRNPDLSVDKEVTSDPGADGVYDLGDTITYTITVRNEGNVTLTGVNVKDELLADGQKIHDLDLENGENITLAPKGHTGDSVTLTADYTVTEEDLGKKLKNTATATAEQTEPEDPDKPVEDKDQTDGEDTKDPTPDMIVDKTVVNGKASYQVGDVITYQITVSNTGNTTIHNVELMDVMQSANGRVTFTNLNGGKLVNGVPVLAALAPKTDWVVTCRYTVQMADADSNGTVISNKVTVDSDDGPNGEDPEDTTPGEPIDPIYTLTIKYQNGARVDLRNPDTVKLHAGDVYTVVAPGINGYHLSDKAYAEFDFTMRDRDTTIVIIYAANPVEDDDDDPVVNPDNDPDETTEETTEETEDEVDPGVYIEDPDDYTLTPITEEEPPLADLDVGDHTCCIMHFLLMLAAMVVLGFYTDSKKKHQARIFELKRTLAMEKGKNPDGDNSQQS